MFASVVPPANVLAFVVSEARYKARLRALEEWHVSSKSRDERVAGRTVREQFDH